MALPQSYAGAKWHWLCSVTLCWYLELGPNGGIHTMEICKCYLQIKDFLFLSLKSWLTSTLLLFVLNLYLKDFCQCPANPYQMSDIWDTTESGSVKVLVAQSCLPLRARMVCSPPGSSVCGTLQARILEWVAILFSRGSS